MNYAVRTVLLEASRRSDEGTASFPEIIGLLDDVGIERYHQDLLRAERTYYHQDGQSEVVHNDPVTVVPAADFSAQGVAAAVSASQAGEIRYKEFCARALASGCVGYLVSLTGRRVVYYGRSGDSHVEWFPGAR